MTFQEFAEQELGRAALGDKRRTARAVDMLRTLAERPAGTVTKVYPKGRTREGAYRHLESPYVRPEGLELARNIGCAERMEAQGGLYSVVVDKTSIRLSDREGTRNFGSVGNRKWGTRGVQVMSAVPLDADGAPVGVLRQDLWARSETPSPARIPGHPSRKRERDDRPASQKESMRWVEVMQDALDIQAEHAPTVQLWFHTDREGDFWGVHKLVAETGVHATVRMNRRRVVREVKGGDMPLMTWLYDRPIEGFIDLTIPPHDGLGERKARLSLRWGKAELRLPVPGKTMWVEKYFVFVDEFGRPNAEDRIQWILSTTRPVRSRRDALRILEQYTRRWRVEDFHRAWKSGCCDIESSQLQSFKAFHCWAIFTSSVAARAEHIKLNARSQPDAPATVAFTLEEIETMIDWRLATTPGAHISYQPGEIPTLAHMTRFVAELGGFMKSHKVLPGAVTIARGLTLLEGLVQGRNLPRQHFRKISG